ncbi:thioredoxin family protein [Desulfofustis glycolicus]|uniref:Thioredoxin n=1 Tax=Desulfofustis glycolicus DSM 9705 TaxID=1121409 RepID=A0A1M5YKE2_9BACT|nr:thioredoxin family protein [Desulfofustis glycolicus]MCB2214775.1 thioredoxin family protein [Desulfobulbaceae bacterium]SHI12515.1 thioredoxin 1 [Desulfofustis glycolicus DSM 9705]
MITEITQQEYEQIDHLQPMLVEFYSKTCGPCKMLSFVLKDISKKQPDFPIYIIDFDENRELKEQLGVKGFPTMLFFKDGAEVSRLEGLKQKPAIIKEIEAIA